MLSGEKISSRLKQSYLESLVNKDVAYLDELGSGQVVTRLTSDINIIQEVISHKTSQCLTALFTFLCAFIIAFVRCWRLALVLTIILPAICIPTGLMSIQVARNAKRGLQQSASTQTHAAEAISAIRTVSSLDIREIMVDMYHGLLSLSKRFGVRRAFWYASNLLVSKELDIGTIVKFFLLLSSGHMP